MSDISEGAADLRSVINPVSPRRERAASGQSQELQHERGDVSRQTGAPAEAAFPGRTLSPLMQIDTAEIKRAHSILDVLAAHGVETYGAGMYRTARCPFHDDHVPSLGVYLDTNRYYCFACAARGDIIDLIQHLEGVGFRDAVARLRKSSPAPRCGSTAVGTSASRHNVAANEPVVDNGHGHGDGRVGHGKDIEGTLAAGEGMGGGNKVQALWRESDAGSDIPLERTLLTVAIALYHAILSRDLGSTDARTYLRQRGLPAWVVERARLGYAPLNDDVLSRFLAADSGATAEAKRLGLLDRAGRDRLRRRIIIPEFRQGQCVWMIGRLLQRLQVDDAHWSANRDEDPPKYLGLSTPKPLLGVGLWRGHRVPKTLLPGLQNPVPSLQPGLLVVEGPFDLLAAHAWRLPVRCVALVGTHLRADLLPELTALAAGGPIWLALDADPAGDAAATQLAHALADYPGGVRRLRPPGGAKDFADLLAQHHGGSSIRQILCTESARYPRKEDQS